MAGILAARRSPVQIWQLTVRVVAPGADLDGGTDSPVEMPTLSAVD
jgi:hypothetical protein